MIELTKLQKLLLAIILAILMSAFSLVVFEAMEPGHAIYWSLCSFSWSQTCGVEAPKTFVGKSLSIIMALFAMAIATYGFTDVLTRLLTGRIKEIFKELTTVKNTKNFKNHYIIAGFGLVGEKVAEILKEKKKEFVIIDLDENRVDGAELLGYSAIRGDALEQRTLELAGIKKAKGLITTLGHDEDNVFLILTANEINPDMLTAAKATSETVANYMKRAGADVIVMPEMVGGIQLAGEILKFDK